MSSRAVPFKTMSEFSSCRIKVKKGLTHSVMVNVLKTVMIMIEALTVVMVCVTSR